jgi:hypothetical protein
MSMARSHLATAHAAKFPKTVKQALGIDVSLPDRAHEFTSKPEKFDTGPMSADFVRQRIDAIVAKPANERRAGSHHTAQRRPHRSTRCQTCRTSAVGVFLAAGARHETDRRNGRALPRTHWPSRAPLAATPARLPKPSKPARHHGCPSTGYELTNYFVRCLAPDARLTCST